MGGSISGTYDGTLSYGGVGNYKEKRAVSNKYEPSFRANEHNIYVEEYFSGPDVRIYLDGEEQYEISQISYSLQEQLKPIYGYASRLYDEVAIGSRIVMGSFTIPLKNKHTNNLSGLKGSFNASYQSSTINDYQRPGWVETLKKYDQNYSTMAARSIQSGSEYGKIRVQQGSQTYRYKAGQSPTTSSELVEVGRWLVILGYLSASDIGNAYNLTYYQAVKAFQKDYLGGAACDGVLTPYVMSAIESEALGKTQSQVSNNARMASNARSASSETVKGNEIDSFFSTSKSNLLRRQGYSILIEIGDHEQYLKALLDIRLRSKSVAVDASGNPIAEVYDFIARDLRENTEASDRL